MEVLSTDGTSLAVWVQGAGPPLVFVHGSLRDHSIFDPLVAQLQSDVTTYSMDRRGFGASGDSSGFHYSIQQEFEDVASVVDAISAGTGQPVALWGHSYGAGCALGAAAISPRVHRLVVHEPGLGIRYPPGWIEANEQALAAGRGDDVVRAVLVDILEMTQEDVASRRATSQWQAYLAAAPAVLREARAENDWVYKPGALDGIKASTTVLVGTETSPPLVKSTLLAAAAIPHAQVRVLGGHDHLAHLVDPVMVAAIARQCVLG